LKIRIIYLARVATPRNTYNLVELAFASGKKSFTRRWREYIPWTHKKIHSINLSITYKWYH